MVSSALETSVGIAAGLALAAALPELPYACGLATLALLDGDVTSAPFRVVDGRWPCAGRSPTSLARRRRRGHGPTLARPPRRGPRRP